MGTVQKQWKVELHRVAEKGIRNLPRDFIQPVWDKIKSLENNPYPNGYETIQGHKDIFRVRVGAYRIVYSLIDDKLLILVLEVGPRGAAYKGKY